MELEEIVDRYKHTRFAVRALLVGLVALGIPAYVWYSDGDDLTIQLDKVRKDYQVSKDDFQKASAKKAELPAMREKKAAIEEQLDQAKRYLPDKIEFDEVLATTAVFEKELGVKLMIFKPGKESEPDPNLKYSEVPVELQLKAGFSEVMAFFDRLVHMEKLVHLRDLNFAAQAVDDKDKPGTVVARANLILFRGNSGGGSQVNVDPGL